MMPFSNGKGIAGLLEYAADQCRKYETEQDGRLAYQEEYPTIVLVLKCIDGRLVFSVWTRTLMGIFHLLRTIGAKFDLGSSHFAMVFREWRKYCRNRDRHALVIVTYHFSSSGESFEGCAGHDYSDQAAYEFSVKLQQQIDGFAAAAHHQNPGSFTARVGMDTCKHSLILHGEGDQRPIDLADVASADEAKVLDMLIGLHPRKWKRARRVVLDMVPWVAGNILHSAEARSSGLAAENSKHRESVMAVGRGFFPGTAEVNNIIAVGPWDIPDEGPIITAAKVIADNLKRGVIETPVLWTSGVWRDSAQDPGEDEYLAKLKSFMLRDFTTRVIRRVDPELFSKMQVVSTTTNTDKMSLHVTYRSH